MSMQEIHTTNGVIRFNDSKPKWQYKPDNFLVHIQNTEISPGIEGRSLYAHLASGNRLLEGILGLRCTSGDPGKVEIRVGYLKEPTSKGIIYVGLSESLAEIVLREAISSINELPFIQSGIYIIDCAAWGEMSTKQFFRYLTRVCFMLLNPNIDLTSQKELEGVIRESSKYLKA